MQENYRKKNVEIIFFTHWNGLSGVHSIDERRLIVSPDSTSSKQCKWCGCAAVKINFN